MAVAVSAYIASVLYQETTVKSPPHLFNYFLVALLIATLVSLVSAGFKQFDAIQMRPLHVLLWSGIGAVGLAFSLLLSILFLLKISEYYSRGTYLCQIVCVSVAVLAVRTIAYTWIRSSIASGVLEARHVVLIGDAKRCAQFRERLKASAIQSVGSFRLPWANVVKHKHDDTKATDENFSELIEACRAIGADDIILLASQDELPKR